MNIFFERDITSTFHLPITEEGLGKAGKEEIKNILYPEEKSHKKMWK